MQRPSPHSSSGEGRAPRGLSKPPLSAPSKKGTFYRKLPATQKKETEVEKTESLSANIRPSDAGPVCKFDQSGDVDDLEMAKTIRITLRVEDE
ncbi:MAG: hypothetical protein ACI304_05240 [Lepagella sp.]